MPSQKKDLPGEKVIFKVRASVILLALRLIGAFVGIGALVILFIYAGGENMPIFGIVVAVAGVGIFLLMSLFLYWYGAVYRLTSKRIEVRRGVLGVKEQEVSLNDVQHVEFSQGILGSILNYGNIIVKSAARDESMILDGIASPRKRSELIEDLAMPHWGRDKK